MCSYNRVNGEFACEDSYLLTDVLKKDFNFKGFLLSDWGGTHCRVPSIQASEPTMTGCVSTRLPERHYCRHQHNVEISRGAAL